MNLPIKSSHCRTTHTACECILDNMNKLEKRVKELEKDTFGKECWKRAKYYQDQNEKLKAELAGLQEDFEGEVKENDSRLAELNKCREELEKAQDIFAVVKPLLSEKDLRELPSHYFKVLTCAQDEKWEFRVIDSQALKIEELEAELERYKIVGDPMPFNVSGNEKLEVALKNLEMYLGPDKWADLFGEEKKGQSPDPTAKELPSTGVASSTITQLKAALGEE